MSKTSDALRKLIQTEIDYRRERVDIEDDLLIELDRSGNQNVGKAIEKVDKLLSDFKKAREVVDETVSTADSARKSIDASKKAAEIAERASTIASSLNPAAAAAAYVQKNIIGKVQVEVQDVTKELHVVPKILENLDDFIDKTKLKLEELSEEVKEGKRIRKERREMLS